MIDRHLGVEYIMIGQGFVQTPLDQTHVSKLFRLYIYIYIYIARVDTIGQESIKYL